MSDAFFISVWWFLFFVVGVASLPLTYRIFRRFVDLGYGFAKTVGFIIVTFTAFLLGILHLAPLTNTTFYLVVAAYIALSAYLFAKERKEISSQILKNLKVLVAQEVLFTLGFIVWTLVRGYQPDINGLEKFMDFGFINSILRSKYLPPPDMWFAGNSINYYWFGHLWVAVATKLSNISSSITYNLMLATILGLTLTAAFSLVSTLVKNLAEQTSLKIKLNRRVYYAAGLISALLLTFAGNFHAPIYILKDGPKNYWYPDATRFIGYNPETNDKTIHEFPIYSFVVSDLHPHLINLPFVLLYIALLTNYLVNTAYSKQRSQNLKSKILNPKQYLKNKIRNSKHFNTLKFGALKLLGNLKLGLRNSQNVIPLGFVLGVMFMTNTWDFGNYLLVTGITVGLFSVIKKGLGLKTLLNLAKTLITIVVIALLTALPFILNFKSLAQGIDFVKSSSPLWQLAILWGFPAILTIVFVYLLKSKKIRLRPSDTFVICLLTASWTLIVIPEVVYVKDIYVGSHHRANTMFKLTYQAYVMLYLVSGYIATRTLTLIEEVHLKRLLFLFYVILFTSILTYPSFAVNSFYGELKNYRGLPGDTWLSDRHPDEYAAVRWFRENVDGQPVILEAPGDSYTEFNVISAYTGLPTVSGWFVHEWLWRGSSEFPQKRVSDIMLIYTSDDIELTKQLLDKYEVEYVIVGPFERQKYPNLKEEKFTQIGKLVFSSGNIKIYQMKPPPVRRSSTMSAQTNSLGVSSFFKRKSPAFGGKAAFLSSFIPAYGDAGYSEMRNNYLHSPFSKTPHIRSSIQLTMGAEGIEKN